MSIKVHTICNRTLIVGILPPHIGDPDMIGTHSASFAKRLPRLQLLPLASPEVLNMWEVSMGGSHIYIYIYI
jgi:hypothetical protein